MKKITITLSEKQMNVLCQALESYSRAKLGQFSYALEHVCRPNKAHCKYHEKIELENIIKKMFFPELGPNCYYGIFSEKVSDDARIAYDIYKVLTHYEAFNKRPEGGTEHWFDKPSKTSLTEELPELTTQAEGKEK